MEKLAELERKDGNGLGRLENFLELARTASLLYKEALPEEKRDLLKKLTSNLKAVAKNVDVELTISAQLIANRRKTVCSALERGVPRTLDVPQAWDGILEQLLKHFVSETATN
jgi:hypothetical protein